MEIRRAIEGSPSLREDIISWKLNKDGKYTTGSIWNDIREKKPQVTWHSAVWFKENIPRHSFILWLAIRDRLATLSRMMQWGGIMDPLCRLCNKEDIGLAMGITGTEVAKESSDIIILDDNFASVVKVVRWGRSVYANIQKFIQFQLTVNVAALVINVVAAVSSGDVPLNAVQFLWVNLIMGTLGALALATEPPTDHLMHRSPVGRREPLITNIMWRNLIIQAFNQVAILLVFNFSGLSMLNLEQETRKHANDVKNSMIFNTFVFCQVFNEFNARKPDEINVFSGVTKNHLFIAP